MTLAKITPKTTSIPFAPFQSEVVMMDKLKKFYIIEKVR